MEKDSRKIIQRLKSEGYELVSVSGSHHKFRKDDKTIIVQHPKRTFHWARHRLAGSEKQK